MHLNGGKLLKCHLNGKSCRKWAEGLNINDSEKKIDPRGSSASTLGQYTHIILLYTNIFS